jgi:hypothetical protein
MKIDENTRDTRVSDRFDPFLNDNNPMSYTLMYYNLLVLRPFYSSFYMLMR